MAVLFGTGTARFATAAVAIGVLLIAAVWSGLGSTAGSLFSMQDASMKVKEEEAKVALHLENRKLKQRLQERTRVTSELAKSLVAGLFWCFANCWVQHSGLNCIVKLIVRDDEHMSIVSLLCNNLLTLRSSYPNARAHVLVEAARAGQPGTPGYHFAEVVFGHVHVSKTGIHVCCELLGAMSCQNTTTRHVNGHNCRAFRRCSLCRTLFPA